MAEITYTIPDEKLDEFKECFLLAEPKPTEIDGEPISDNAWIKKWGRMKFMQAYIKGKLIKAKQSMEIDKEIIV